MACADVRAGWHARSDCVKSIRMPHSPAPRRARLSRPEVIALVISVVGGVYRAFLLAADVPPTNSDEATLGLAALHISTGREFPIFFYGQAYMGTLLAYLAAPLFWVLGPSTLVLRLPTLALYLAFVLGMYLLVRRLYSPWLAVVTVAALALGSDRVIKNQLIAAGGYPEISPAAVWLLLVSVLLGANAMRPRPWVLACWGMLVGILIWDDWLILPYIAAAAAVLLTGCREVVRRRGLLLFAAGGVLVGAAPLVIHHLTRPLSESSISAYLRLADSAADGSIADHLYGGVLFGIPMGSGLCSPSRCEPWQMWWGAAYPVLLAVAVALAVRALRQATRAQDKVIQAGRLALLGAAALTVALYARSGASVATPVESARYLSPLLISLPAVLWPLWAAAAALGARLARGDLAPAARRWARIGTVGAVAPVAGLLVTMLIATVALVAATPQYGRQADQRRLLANTLERQGARHIYSDYWTCNLVTFATRERVMCAVLDEDLSPGLDRYLPYRKQVAAAETVAIVAPVASGLDARVAAWLNSTGVPYRTTAVAGYHIYHPTTRPALPAP